MSNHITAIRPRQSHGPTPAYYRYIKRKYTIWPKEIPGAEQKMGEKRALCTIINDFLANRDPAELVMNKKITQKKRTLYLHLDKTEQKMLLVIYGEEPSCFGTNLKSYFPAKTLEIKIARKKDAHFYDSVLMRINDIKNGLDFSLRCFLEGNATLISLHKKCEREQPQDVYLAPPFDQLDVNLFTQKRLLGSMQTFFCDPRSNGLHIPLYQKVVSTVKWVNDQGIVHRDIKFDNFLIQQNPDQTFTPLLTDFDLSGNFGTEKSGWSKEEYPLWDPCCSYRGVKALTDVYSITCMYLLTWTQVTTSELSSKRDLIMAYTENQKRFHLQGTTWNGVTFENLTQRSRLRVRLFVHVCQESAKLAFHFHKIKGPISHEEAKSALIQLNTPDFWPAINTLVGKSS